MWSMVVEKQKDQRGMYVVEALAINSQYSNFKPSCIVQTRNEKSSPILVRHIQMHN